MPGPEGSVKNQCRSLRFLILPEEPTNDLILLVFERSFIEVVRVSVGNICFPSATLNSLGCIRCVIIGIKHGAPCINICQVPGEGLKSEVEDRGF